MRYLVNIHGPWEDIFACTHGTNAASQSRPPPGQAPALLHPRENNPQLRGLHMPYPLGHRILWISPRPVLQRINSRRILSNIWLTIPCATLWEKAKLRGCERPFVIHRDAVPATAGNELVITSKRQWLTIWHAIDCLALSPLISPLWTFLRCRAPTCLQPRSHENRERLILGCYGTPTRSRCCVFRAKNMLAHQSRSNALSYQRSGGDHWCFDLSTKS